VTRVGPEESASEHFDHHLCRGPGRPWRVKSVLRRQSPLRFGGPAARSSGVSSTTTGRAIRWAAATFAAAAMALAAIGAAPAVALPPADPVPTAPAPAPPAANALPVAGFAVDTPVPVVGRPVSFTSTSVDIDGTIALEQWDLNGDGVFTDASGQTATWTFAQPGSHVVRMSVTDNLGAVSIATVTIVVDRPPVAAFTVSPGTTVVAGDTVTFASTSRDADGSIARLEWALDADGAFDDGGAATVRRTYPATGAYPVRLRATDDRGVTATTTALVTVIADKAPLASFTFAPVAPLVGQAVSFTGRATDPDGSIAGLAWDLNGDGSFDDAAGASAARTYLTAGNVVVAFRATDDRGASSIAFGTVSIRGTVPHDAPTAPSGSSMPGASPPGPVSRPGFPLIAPFPIVRIRGQITGGVVRITLLSVHAPRGAAVLIRCRGHGCPRARVRAGVLSSARALRVKAFEARYRPGAEIEVFVTMPGRIGKFVRFTIRRAAAPKREDQCTGTRGTTPIRCPTR
jgi:PKD repeat protein